MADVLVVFAGETPEEVVEWRSVGRGGAITSRGVSALDELSGIRQSELIVILPGTQIGCFRTVLGAKNERQARSVAGYAIEDDIAGDISTEHIAIGFAAVSQRTYTICTINAEKLEQWINTLSQFGLSASKILPDYFVLPELPGSVAVAPLRYRTVLRAGAFGAAIDVDLGASFIDAAIESAGQKWLATSTENSDPAFGVQNIADDSETALDVMAAQAVAGGGLNLRQGRFIDKRRTKSQASILEEWKWPAAVGVMAVLVASAVNVTEGVMLNQSADQIETQTEQEMRAAFPELKRIVNPTAQLRTALQSKSVSGSEFLQLTSMVSLAVDEVDGFTVESVRFDDARSQLQVSILYTDYDQLNRFKQIIEGVGGKLEDRGSRQQGDRRAGNIMVSK